MEKTIVKDNTKQEKKVQNKKPKKYHVIFLNDEYTPFEFVVNVLKTIFRKNDQEAFLFTKQVDETGQGIAGTYSFEIAETKYVQTMQEATKHEYPLQLKIEPE